MPLPIADDNIANNCSMSTPSTNMAATNANTSPSSSDIDEELGGGSSPSLGTSSFLSRQHHSNNANNKHRADDEAHNISERSSTSSITGRWKSLGSRRHIKFGMSSHPDDRRGILAIPMNEDTSKPMNAVDRFKRTVFRRSSYNQEHDNEELTKNECNEKKMYRLQVTRQNEVGCIRRSMACVMACLNCGAHTEQSTEQNLFLGLGSPNRWLIDFFYWLFRKGWFTIFAVALVMFYLLVIFFGALITWAAVMDSDCIRIGDNPFEGTATRSLAAQAFALSWHTFSTVGYGSTYPALSTQHNHNNDVRCAFINFICPIEALIGVMYGAFTGAVIFAKVTRVSQRAKVKFSEPLLIQFGKGVDERVGASGDVFDRTKTAQDSPKKKFTFKSAAKQVTRPSPFPIVEFRLANEHHSVVGGEIIGANVSVVVLQESTNDSEFEVDTDMAKQIAINRMRRESARSSLRKTGTRKSEQLFSERSTDTSTVEISHGSESSEGSRGRHSVADAATAYLHGLNTLAQRATAFGAKKIKIDEETADSSRIVPRMIFSKLSLDSTEHPLFKRVWGFRHVIDENSPLLTKEARQKIMMNGGHWKWEWNTPEYIRKAVHFEELIVSFTGVSTLSNFSVYKQKAYDPSSLVIGYEFVNMLYHSRRGKLKVDLSLLSDVVEQNSGNGEPLVD